VQDSSAPCIKHGDCRRFIVSAGAIIMLQFHEDMSPRGIDHDVGRRTPQWDNASEGAPADVEHSHGG
jgi:hypothetical protein